MKALFVQGVLNLGAGWLMLAWIVEGTWRAGRDVRALARERHRRRVLAHLEDYRIGPGVPAP